MRVLLQAEYLEVLTARQALMPYSLHDPEEHPRGKLRTFLPRHPRALQNEMFELGIDPVFLAKQ